MQWFEQENEDGGEVWTIGSSFEEPAEIEKSLISKRKSK
jgi:hypothetical protein